MIVENKRTTPAKRRHNNEESKIQASAVTWFWNTFPQYRGLFIHIPNEGNRSSKMDGSIRKSLGIVAGAPDTFLFVPKGIFHGLAVEFKTSTGRQSESQKLFQERLERMTYRYEIVRSLDDFITVINSYLSIT